MKHGEIVELVVRKNHLSISELSRQLNVSRRCLYNWFTQKDLSPETIKKIGDVLKYDFSREFPDLKLKKNGFTGDHSLSRNGFMEDQSVTKDFNDRVDAVNYWRSKYIQLLEKHNDLLVHNRQ
jgi:hypothetical protein